MTGRRVGAAAVLGATASLALSTLLAGPAFADGAITSPGAGTVFQQDTTVAIIAKVDGRPVRPTSELRLTDPLGNQHTVATAPPSLTDSSLRYDLVTSCPSYADAPCAGTPALNGTWTVALSGGGEDTKTFVLRIPPRAPELKDVQVADPHAVVVTWKAGPEQDLRGYSIVDGNGTELATAPLSDCDGGSCAHTVGFAADGPHDETLAVRAVRSQCPDCPDTLVSASSAAKTVSRPAPSPSASPGASAGAPTAPGRPSASSSGAASATPSPSAPVVVARGTTEGPLLQPFGGSGDAQLPGLLGSGLLASGAPTPLTAPAPANTYAPTLPFGDQVVREPVPAASPSAVEALGAGVQDAAQQPQLVRSIAGALILLLAGAHLRRWLSSTAPRP